MPHLKDRVQETTTTTGNSTITLAGAKTGYRTFFSCLELGEMTHYCITDGTNWEIGKGYLVTSSTLYRDTVLSSSTGTFIVFGAGSKDVFVTASAEFLDNASMGMSVAARANLLLP